MFGYGNTQGYLFYLIATLSVLLRDATGAERIMIKTQF
jgi:hypothetical protein